MIKLEYKQNLRFSDKIVSFYTSRLYQIWLLLGLEVLDWWSPSPCRQTADNCMIPGSSQADIWGSSHDSSRCLSPDSSPDSSPGVSPGSSSDLSPDLSPSLSQPDISCFQAWSRSRPLKLLKLTAQTDIATYRLNRPQGQFSNNLIRARPLTSLCH